MTNNGGPADIDTRATMVDQAVGARRVRRPGISPPLAVVAGLGIAFLALPLGALVLRAPWGDMWQILTTDPARQALLLSAITATSATVLCLVLGAPIALMLARGRSRGLWIVRSLVVLPLVLPPIVGGVALLSAFGRTTPVGDWLYGTLGWQLPFTTAAVVVAETFVAMPFVVLTIEAALRTHGESLEEAAAVLGASRWQRLRMVTAPTLAPAVIAAAVLGFARALGEFGATVTFAGSFPGTTQTLPLAIYGQFESDPQAAIAMSVLLLVFTAVILMLFRRRIAGWNQS